MMRGALVSAVLLVGAAALPAFAAEWAIEPSVASRVEFNDNWRLQPTNQQAVTTLSLTPHARFSTSTELSSLSFELGATGYKAFGDDNLTRVDGVAALGARSRTERATYGLDARFLRDSAVATELRDTGVVLDRIQRNLYEVQGEYKYALTQRLSAIANGGAQFARYQTTGANGISDHNNFAVRGGAEYLVSERTTFSSQLGWGRFATVPSLNKASTWSLNNTLEHRFTERFKGSLALGVARVSTEVQQTTRCFVGGAEFPLSVCAANNTALTVSRSAIDETKTTQLYGGTIDWQYLPESTLTAGVRQEVLPSAVGTLLRVLSVFTALDHGFSEKLRAGADIRFVDSNFIGGSAVGADSQAWFLGAQIRYRLTTSLSVESGARRIQVRYPNNAANADSNMVYGQVRYEWPRLAVSR